MVREVFQLATDASFVQPLQPVLPGTVAMARIPITMPAGTGGTPEGFGEVYELSKVDQLPQAIVQVPPDYPLSMRSGGISGQVLVDCIVDAKGDVKHAYAAKSTRPQFELAAVLAVNKWKFQPGERHGRAVSTHVQVPILFSLNTSPFQ
jgi:protein TonB